MRLILKHKLTIQRSETNTMSVQWMGYNATDDFCFSGVNTLCGAFRNASPKVYHAAVLRNDTLRSFSAHILKFGSSQKQRDRRRAKRPDP